MTTVSVNFEGEAEAFRAFKIFKSLVEAQKERRLGILELIMGESSI